MSALPTLTAVTLMRCVAIMWDPTHAPVKQDSQAMDTHALVRRLSLYLFYILVLRVNQLQQQCSTLFVLFLPFQ